MLHSEKSVDYRQLKLSDGMAWAAFSFTGGGCYRAGVFDYAIKSHCKKIKKEISVIKM